MLRRLLAHDVDIYCCKKNKSHNNCFTKCRSRLICNLENSVTLEYKGQLWAENKRKHAYFGNTKRGNQLKRGTLTSLSVNQLLNLMT